RDPALPRGRRRPGPARPRRRHDDRDGEAALRRVGGTGLVAADDRPVAHTPVSAADLPATPTRDRNIPATAWVEAPEEGRRLGEDLGHHLAAYNRRIGPWRLW